MDREKVKFAPNVPTQVILDGPGALQPSNRNGAREYRYFLAGEKIMWVPEEVHAAIERGGAIEGSLVTIAKQVNRDGGHEQWKVSMGSPARAARNAAAGISQVATPAARAAAQAEATPAAAPAVELPIGEKDRYAAALHDAIDLAAQAADYGDSQHMVVSFTGADLIKIAAALIGGI